MLRCDSSFGRATLVHQFMNETDSHDSRGQSATDCSRRCHDRLKRFVWVLIVVNLNNVYQNAKLVLLWLSSARKKGLGVNEQVRSLTPKPFWLVNCIKIKDLEKISGNRYLFIRFFCLIHWKIFLLSQERFMHSIFIVRQYVFIIACSCKTSRFKINFCFLVKGILMLIFENTLEST